MSIEELLGFAKKLQLKDRQLGRDRGHCENLEVIKGVDKFVSANSLSHLALHLFVILHAAGLIGQRSVGCIVFKVDGRGDKMHVCGGCSYLRNSLLVI